MQEFWKFWFFGRFTARSACSSTCMLVLGAGISHAEDPWESMGGDITKCYHRGGDISIYEAPRGWREGVIGLFFEREGMITKKTGVMAWFAKHHGVKAWLAKDHGVMVWSQNKLGVLAWLAKNYGVMTWFRNWCDGGIAQKLRREGVIYRKFQREGVIPENFSVKGWLGPSKNCLILCGCSWLFSTSFVEKVAGTKRREVAQSFGKFSVLKVAGIWSRTGFPNKKSWGFDVAQNFKTKSHGDLM